MSGLSNSGDRSDFFFEPLQFHFEASDLPEQFGLVGLGVRGGGSAAIAEDLVCAVEQQFFPTVDERRVDPELTGQFVDGLVTLEGSQGDLGLERCCVVLPLTCHRFPLSWATSTSLAGGPVFGVHYTGLIC